MDFRHAVRSLKTHPGFTAVAVTSLALGIMATTAVYSVLYAVVIDPFPYKDVDTLMSVKVQDQRSRAYNVYYTPDEYLEIAQRSKIFNGVIASTISDVRWTGRGLPLRVRGNYVTTNTFQVLGVPPLLGRAIAPADGAADAPAVAVLGYKFWQRQFGGAGDALGRQMLLNGEMRTVVGVMPQRFMWRGADVYLPIVYHRGQPVEGIRFVHVLGRLKPGVTAAQAEADLQPIVADLKGQFPSDFPDRWRVGLLSFKETFPGSIQRGIWILFGAGALLLLIACSNVSNLLLSKGASRQKEMAIRGSLGASRARLLRQLLSESLVLALAAGAIGVALAYAALDAIVAIMPPGTIPDESHIAMAMPVLLFALGVSIATSILFGLAPALHTAGRDLANPLKQTGRGISGSSAQGRLRNGLVVGEVALSLMLLVTASLMIRTLIARQGQDLGFRSDRVLTMSIPLAPERYRDAARRNAFFEELLRRTRALPGVRAVGLNTSMHPFGNWLSPLETGAGARDTRPVEIQQTNAAYTAALGIPLLEGRMFTPAEVAAKRRLCVVNRALVDRYFGGHDALGRTARLPRLLGPQFHLPDDSFQIVGVVRDAVNNIMGEERMPEIYIPYTIAGMSDTLLLSTDLQPMALANAVRDQVYAMDKDQPVMQVQALDTALDQWVYAGPRFNLVLFALFAFMGLTLAAIGVYGVMSHLVSQQTQEIGVRMALGATLSDITGMVIGRGFRLLAGGVAAGLIGSLCTVHLLSKQIWGVSPFDPLSFGAMAALLLSAGLQACFWPARRAARVDPMRALRHE